MKKLRITIFTILSSVIVYAGCGHTTAPLPVLSDKFHDLQTSIFTPSCAYAGCHDQETAKSLLCLNSDSCYSQLFHHIIQENQNSTFRFLKLITPGNVDSSFLVYKLTKANGSADYGDRMPDRLNALPQNQIDAIVSWIKRGAPND
jgi:hypothetical protein